MKSVLLWLYLSNLILLLNHELDSAYWKEWRLFKLPGGITGFLLIHFPLFFLVLIGLLFVYQYTLTGLLFSLFLGLSGIFAFSIHTYFFKKGNKEFNTLISKLILWAILFASTIQLIVTVLLILKGIDNYP